jgi:hypothetical protein
MLGASWWERIQKRPRGFDSRFSIVWTLPNSTAERGNATLRPCNKSLLLVPTGCVLSGPIQTYLDAQVCLIEHRQWQSTQDLLCGGT